MLSWKRCDLRVTCTAVCPFMIYGELVQRWRLAQGAVLRKWPHKSGRCLPSLVWPCTSSLWLHESAEAASARICMMWRGCRFCEEMPPP